MNILGNIQVSSGLKPEPWDPTRNTSLSGIKRKWKGNRENEENKENKEVKLPTHRRGAIIAMLANKNKKAMEERDKTKELGMFISDTFFSGT